MYIQKTTVTLKSITDTERRKKWKVKKGQKKTQQ